MGFIIEMLIKRIVRPLTFGFFVFLYYPYCLAVSNSYEMAVDYFAASNFDAAAIELRTALKNTPRNAPARVLFGQVLLELDDPRQAVIELEKGLALGGDRNLILPTLGRAYLQLLDPQKVLTSVVPPGTNPTVDGELMLINGDAALLLGDLHYATNSFEGALSYLRNDARPLVGKARIALARGKQSLAKSLLEQALDVDSSSIDAWVLKGMLHRDVGERELSRRALNRSLELDPLSTKALGARAALLLDMGDREAATSDISLLRDINPSDLEGLYLQAWLLISDGQTETAQLMLQEVVDALSFFTPDQRALLPQTELLSGLVNFLSQKYAQAIENFTTFLARFPNHGGAKRYLAASYLTIGDWDGVIKTLNPSTLGDLPSDAATLSLLAEAYRAQGNSKRAVQLYERALTISPSHTKFAMGLASSRFAAGDIEQGISEMLALVNKLPNFKGAVVELVGMYSDSGQTEEALSLATKLLENAPNDIETHNLLGVVCMQAKNYSQAKEYFSNAIALDSDNTVANLNLARVAQRRGYAKQAMQIYQTLLSREPELEPALIELAELFIARSRYQDATPLLQTITQRHPRHLRASIAKLWLLLPQGDKESLESEVYTLADQYPNSAVAQLGVAKVYLAIGDQDKARLALKRAGENAGFNADQLYEVSRLLLSVGDANGALWATTKALAGNSRHLPSLTHRVVILLKMDKISDAQTTLEDIKRRYPERGETHEAQGRLALAAGDLGAAEGHFAVAHRLTPNSSTLRQLFNTQIDSGNVEEALKTIRVWILLHPDDMDSRHALAEKLIDVGAWRPAQLVYEGILKRTSADPVLLNNLAYVTHKLGGSEALEFARQAVEIAPDQAGFLDTYGWILVETGRPGQGLEILRDAFTRQSTNQEIRYHIAVALVQLERENAAYRELEAALNSSDPFPSKLQAQALIEQLRAKLD